MSEPPEEFLYMQPVGVIKAVLACQDAFTKLMKHAIYDHRLLGRIADFLGEQLEAEHRKYLGHQHRGPAENEPAHETPHGHHGQGDQPGA